MLWEWYTGQPAPWRADPRLGGRFAPGYKDDVQVLFLNPDSAAGKRPELMWVRIIAYDSVGGQYLGILLNQPDVVSTVGEIDNVVFGYDPARGYPTAVMLDGRYDTAGWPSSAAPAFFARLRDGIRAYRKRENSIDKPSVDRCIAVLTPAMSNVPAAARPDERFVGHYVLGRCLSEEYKTEAAAEQFRAAIAIDSTDYDAHMALLAELSVMTHKRPGTQSPADDARWEQAFLTELAVVRGRFADRPAVQQTLEYVFNPALETQLDSVWRGSIPKLRRVGYVVFRWKQR